MGVQEIAVHCLWDLPEHPCLPLKISDKNQTNLQMNALRWAANRVGDLAEHAALTWKMPSLAAMCAVSTLSPPWLGMACPVAAATPDTEADGLAPEQQNDLSLDMLPQLPVCRQSCFSCVQLFAVPWIAACQTPLSMGFSRQEYWRELPCPPSGGLPDPGIRPMSLVSPALAGNLYH